jgi:hypothetical protein
MKDVVLVLVGSFYPKKHLREVTEFKIVNMHVVGQKRS